MTLNDFYLAYGTEGLRALAQRSGTTLRYLIKVNCRALTPGPEMMRRLIEESEKLIDGGLGPDVKGITAHGLVYPTNPPKPLPRRPRLQKVRGNRSTGSASVPVAAMTAGGSDAVGA